MKNYKKIIISFIISIFTIGMVTISKAESIDLNELEEFITEESTVDVNNITESDIITLYEELTEKYTNEELADTIEEYSAEMQQEGIDKETIDAGVALLRTTDEKELKKILEEDLDIEQIKERLNQGEDLEEIVTDMNINPLSIGLKLLLANSIFQTVITIAAILGIYSIIVRWKIYSKAGKHGWAALIPIYRDVVWLKIAGITPWTMLLLLLPIIGWISLALIMIISKFTISKAFGRGVLFGLGLWVLPVIFESIMAFSNKIEYTGDEYLK